MCYQDPIKIMVCIQIKGQCTKCLLNGVIDFIKQTQFRCKSGKNRNVITSHGISGKLAGG